MSDHKDTKLELVDLLPNEIQTDPKYDVRPFERHATAESQQQSMEALQLLADNIEANGQMDACCITADHVLICGHRRRRAIILINQRKAALGQPLRRVHCSIDRSTGDLTLKAISSNLHRKNLSPIDLAYAIHNYRTQHDLLGYKGAGITAKLLHIPRHIVDRGEHLMNSSKEIQNRLHEGVISVDTAVLLMHAGLPVGELTRVFERSREIQQENQTSKAMDDVDSKRKTSAGATAELARISTAKRIEKPSVEHALREYEATKPLSVSRPRKDIPLSYNAFLKGLSAADTPAQCPQARKLLRFLVKEYAAGRSSQGELERRISLAFSDDSPVPSRVPLQQPAACY